MKSRTGRYVSPNAEVTRPVMVRVDGRYKIMTTDSSLVIEGDHKNHHTERKLFSWMLKQGMWYELRQNKNGDYDICVPNEFYKPVANKLESLLGLNRK